MVLLCDGQTIDESGYVSGLKAIKGSAAECERCFGMADAIYTKRRSRTSPLLLECIMFLKYNHSLWNLPTIVEANIRRKNEVKVARMDKLR